MKSTKNLRTVLKHVDVVYPMDANLGWVVFQHLNVIPWIPDFQHMHMPGFFSPAEIALRDKSYASIFMNGRMTVVSSESALKDCKSLFPQSGTLIRALPFHVQAPPLDEADPLAAQAKYGLPDNFLICCNQFWRHKDHPTLLCALASLDGGRDPVTLVCTGGTHDSRSPDYTGALARQIHELGLEARVRILGIIDRQDQLALMRRALAVLQPSLFEGWSTVVEDCRCLGKALILSDIAVHQEQNPPGGTFFRAGDHESLAAALAEALPRLRPGPDRLEEEKSALLCRKLCERFARRFVSIMKEATLLAMESGC